jgi:transcription termination/antitermination protein NusG
MNQHDPSGDPPESDQHPAPAEAVPADPSSGADSSAADLQAGDTPVMSAAGDAGEGDAAEEGVQADESAAESQVDEAGVDADVDEGDEGFEEQAPKSVPIAAAGRTSSAGAASARTGAARPAAVQVEEPEPAAAPGEPMQWYVLKVQSNRERTIKESLLRRVKRDGLEPYFGEIVIPTEKRVETKGGKKRVFEQKLYPGYIMIHMVLNDETWYLVRDTGGVGDFTGAAGKPLPMPEAEVQAMLKAGQEIDDEPKKVKISLAQGDTVKIKEGPFENFEGSVNSIDEASGKVSVMIQILGRSAPVDLEYWQVERV